jgi:hypothetical protein
MNKSICVYLSLDRCEKFGKTICRLHEIYPTVVQATRLMLLNIKEALIKRLVIAFGTSKTIATRGCVVQGYCLFPLIGLPLICI